jgi:hypothetical protein
VKPYVKTNKNDYIDAEAIAEAVTMDTKSGAHFIPATISDADTTVTDPLARAEIFEGTACRVLGIRY